MRTAAATALALLLAIPTLAGNFASSPSTTNNDDSCDISLQPAATLLLPYFEVDLNAPRECAVQTLFTIQNVSSMPQIANVTLWTDWGFPAFNFSIFLTGYDVQPVNLYDVVALGALPPTSSKTPVPINPTPGSQPADNAANPNFFPGAMAACASLPSSLDPLVARERHRLRDDRRRLYLNLDNGGSANYSAARSGYGPRGRASQAWVITSMFAEPTYAIETTAIALGNGCTPRAPLSGEPKAQIGPAPNPTP